MCGIVGFFAKDGGGQGEIGQTVLNMLRALGCRGPDSAGVALFGARDADRFVVRLKLGDDGDLDSRAHQISERLESFGGVSHFSTTGAYARFIMGGDTDLNGLIAAIESLEIHKPFFTARVSEALLESFLTKTSQAGSILSHRERAVVQLIAEGHTNKETGELLNISLKTVESHRASVMRKLNLASSADLVRYAIRNRLVEA